MNIQLLLDQTLNTVKDYVDQGFREMSQEIKDRESALKKSVDEQLASIKESIPASPDLSGFAELSNVEQKIEDLKESIKIPDPMGEKELISFIEGQKTQEILSNLVKSHAESLKEGIKTAVLAEIPTPTDGEDGVDGKDGKDGKDGVDGKDGQSVAVADVEPLVKDLIVQQFSKIELPKDGADGKDGKDGVDGRDALDITILPGIDFNKSYQRGTYAAHDGGVLRAFTKTDGKTGWEPVLVGIADIQLDMENERTLVVRSRLTNGVEDINRFPVPTMVYRGVFKEGETYLPGDTVTWGGCIWHCEKETDQKPTDNHSSWRLAVKKGRDAK